MALVRASVAALLLTCSGLAAVFDYNVSINTSFLGTDSGWVAFSLFDTDAENTTEMSVTNVRNFTEASGTPRTFGDVEGSLGDSNLVIRDGNFVNAYWEIGATFGNPFSFDIRFDMKPGYVSDDSIVFGIGSRYGYVIDLFSFSRGQLIIPVTNEKYVTVAQVSVPEPSSLAVLLLSLAAIGGAAVWQRRRRLV